MRTAILFLLLSADAGTPPRHFDSWEQCEVAAAKWYGRVGQEMRRADEALYERDQCREDLRVCTATVNRHLAMHARDGGAP